MSKDLLVIASAGGHLTQALCLTSEFDGVILVSNKNTINDARVKKVYSIPDTQFSLFIHFINIFTALFIILKHRPKAILSTGGPIALPFALISKVLRFKFVFVDTLSRVTELSNTGKVLKKYGLYDCFYSQWEKIAKENNVNYIGKCFDILNENSSTKKLTPLDNPKIPLILVTLGTCDYPFQRFMELIAEHPLYQNPSVRWVIQAGDTPVNKLPKNGKVVQLVSRDEIEDLIKEASLVISHCGIGSINLMLSYQKRVFFVPRVKRYGEFSDDHQLQIANEIENPLFNVVYPDNPLPELDYDELASQERYHQPKNIINNRVSKEIYRACS